MPEPFRARPKQVWALVREAVKEFVQDRANKQAAALAYYALFALGPLLLITVAVAGIFVGTSDAREAITTEFGRLLGPQGQEAILSLMEGSDRDGSGIVGLVMGVAALLIGALAAFHQLRDSLDRVWEVERVPEKKLWRKVVRFLRENLLGAAGALGIGFLLLVSLAISAGLAAVVEQASDALPFDVGSARIVHIVATTLAAFLVFALMFRYMPDAVIRWRDVLFGASATAVLFVIGEILIGLYIGQTATASRYGAAGAIIVVILWVYYSSLILFFGAELTQVYANRFGKGVQPADDAETLIEYTQRRQSHPSTEGTRHDGTNRPRKYS